jgi:hypothetical protein
MPKLWTAEMMTAINNLKKDYRTHCKIFFLICAVPLIFYFLKKLFNKFLIFRKKD